MNGDSDGAARRRACSRLHVDRLGNPVDLPPRQFQPLAGGAKHRVVNVNLKRGRHVDSL